MMKQKRNKFDKLYPHNTYGGREFKGIKNEWDFKVPVISKQSTTEMWFDPFAVPKGVPAEAIAINPYTPLSQDAYCARATSQKPNNAYMQTGATSQKPNKTTPLASDSLPNLSDAYNPKNDGTPLLGKLGRITLKNKFPDQSQDRRDPDIVNIPFSNIDRNISMVSDRMMDIEQPYSLPLWNARDYFQIRGVGRVATKW
jgi:hypothetical protein